MTRDTCPESRSGFVAIVGCTNSGKSTLINSLVGTKVAMVSRKVQATRHRILGMTLCGKSQLIFIDTPGFFEAKKRLDRAMVQTAMTAPKDSDCTLVLLDPHPKHMPYHKQLIDKVHRVLGQQKAFFALNKADLLSKEETLKTLAHLQSYVGNQPIHIISAQKGHGLDTLKRELAAAVPAGPYLYPPEQVTDQTQRMLAAEITREKVYKRLQEELPYAIHVETETFKTLRDGTTSIGQCLHVLRPSHKAIVLGKNGQMLKGISMDARTEMGHHFGCTVHLLINVRISEMWQERRDVYRDLGLPYDPKKL